jgi:xanthine dehydrogenase accessory factor
VATVIDGRRAGASIALVGHDVAGDLSLSDTILPPLRARDVRTEEIITLDVDGEPARVYIERLEPPRELIVVGGGHIGRSLSFIGAHLGFSVTVIDDREAYANSDRFPESDRVICADFTDALNGLNFGPWSSVVVVTRGHKQDEIALSSVAASDAGYVGMIGSKRRVAAVLQHLAQEGIPVEHLERIHTPIGLDIGAETPEEIALSILAEIVKEQRGGTGKPMVEGRRDIRR